MGFLNGGGIFFQGVIDGEMDVGVDLTDCVCIFEEKEKIGHGWVSTRINRNDVALEGL